MSADANEKQKKTAKILYLFNKGLMTPDFAISLMLAGYEVDVIDDYVCSYMPDDAACMGQITGRLKAAHPKYDCVVSHNFIPSAAQVCMQYKLPYISWMYDAWQPSLHSEYGRLPCNRIFVFDSAEYAYLKNRGLRHVYYLPLAVNADRLGALTITGDDERIYQSDVSMVGRLYCTDGVNGYNQMRGFLASDVRAYIDRVIRDTAGRWTDDAWQERLRGIDYSALPVVDGADKREACLLEDNIYYTVMCFARAITQQDRTLALNALGKIADTRIYTYERPSGLSPAVKVMPGVDYMNQMPKVFYCSKINLNITLRSITNGIPLRAMDVMGSGGFLMTNRQRDMDLYFKDGKDYVSFSSVPELTDKVRYYLAHEDERRKILFNGYTRVCQYHTYRERIDEMYKMMNGGD